MKTPALAVLLLATGCYARHDYRTLVTRPEKPAALLVQDVRVFTATSREALEHRDVLVEGDRIVSVAPTGAAPPPGAKVIVGKGRTLLPGLVDAHAHVTGSPAPPWALEFPSLEHNLQAHLYAGVTTLFDMGGPLKELEELRRQTASGERMGPRLLFAGPILTPVKGYPVSMMDKLLSAPARWLAARNFAWQLTGPEEATDAVKELIAKGVDLIKIQNAEVPAGSPRFDTATLAAIVKAAHEGGRKVGAHIDTAEHALEVARAGVDVLVHGIHLSDLTVEQAAELKRLGVQVVPTISTFDHIDQLRAGSYVPSALERETEGDEVLAPFRPEVVKAQELPPGFVSWIGVLQQNRPFRQSTVKTLFDAGVTILVGSDASGSIACHPGGSLHEELGQLAQAGLPNVDILLGATSRGAALYQGTPDFGTVEVGKAADLLIVEGNPLEDLTALDRIAFVVRRGQLLERKTPPK